jgi:hypothetical protein
MHNGSFTMHGSFGRQRFWSLVLQPNMPHRYDTNLEMPFLLTNVCLENPGPSIVQVYVEEESNNCMSRNPSILLVNLSRDQPNATLQLEFGAGQKFTFQAKGQTLPHLPWAVHLSGIERWR